jgi:hypothetical protein
MSNKLFFASLLPLLASSTVAGAQPAERMRPSPLLDIEVVVPATHAKVTSTHVWMTGGWSFEDFRGKTPSTASGRLTEHQLRVLRDELGRAPWQHRYTQPPCAIPQLATEYRVKGQLVYTAPGCGDSLDETSVQVLAFTRGFLAGAIAPSTTVAAGCERVGTPLVELDERERTYVVYRNGAWALDTRVAGQAETHQEHCLGRDVMAKIEADVAAASWTISHPIHCMAISLDYMIVKIDGRKVFTERMCNPDQLDDKSARMLAEIEQLMGAGASPVQPACAPQGTPVIELDFDDVRTHSPQRVVTLWSTSAWTVDETVDGKQTSHRTGCLAGDALSKIETEVKTAPWQVQQLQITCRAFSSRSTVVKINGKQVIVERLCGNEKLDDASAKHLAEIEKLLDAATKAP